MKILLVGGGNLPIPPTSWGGVENVIWQQYNFLKRAGHEVDIVNRKQRWLYALQARPWQYDLVHLHLDSGAKIWGPLQRLIGFRLALTTHFGYAGFPERWSPKYQKTFRRMARIPYQITLSHEISDLLYQRGYKGKAWVLPNGIETSDMRFDPAPAPRQSLVLGRVQERKKQRFLAEILADEPLTLDLIGPTDDPAFTGNGKNVRFLGPWNRDTVQKDLTEYAAMVLISDGEAHAGVILEAMAAGLSLVISPESSHNLDCNQPWVHVVDRDRPEEIRAALRQAIAENPKYRTEIRRYCEAAFDWKVIGPRYLRILQAIVQGDGSADGGEPFSYVPELQSSGNTAK